MEEQTDLAMKELADSQITNENMVYIGHLRFTLL